MTIPQKAVEYAVEIAKDDSHGYDQTNRWGPDYDCSSLVISAYKAAGVPLTATYTGNMWRDFLAHGFFVPAGVNLATGAGLEPGDVLLNEQSHTAMYIGNGLIVNAGGNELGKVTGGKTGDQTGNEIRIRAYYNFPWDVVLRYGDEQPKNTGTYIVKSGESLWSIAEKLLGDPWRYHEIITLNGLQNAMIYPGQALKIPGKAPDPEPVTLTVTVSIDTANKLESLANAKGKTVGEIIDGLVMKC